MRRTASTSDQATVRFQSELGPALTGSIDAVRAAKLRSVVRPGSPAITSATQDYNNDVDVFCATINAKEFTTEEAPVAY